MVLMRWMLIIRFPFLAKPKQPASLALRLLFGGAPARTAGFPSGPAAGRPRPFIFRERKLHAENAAFSARAPGRHP